MFYAFILIIFARIVEAVRDAIDFESGAKPMNKTWHWLKWHQYGSWLCAGIIIGVKAALSFTSILALLYGVSVFVGMSLFIAWPVFELTLLIARKVVRAHTN